MLECIIPAKGFETPACIRYCFDKLKSKRFSSSITSACCVTEYHIKWFRRIWLDENSRRNRNPVTTQATDSTANITSMHESIFWTHVMHTLSKQTNYLKQWFVMHENSILFSVRPMLSVYVVYYYGRCPYVIDQALVSKLLVIFVTAYHKTSNIFILTP